LRVSILVASSRRLTIAFEPGRLDHEKTVGQSRKAEESNKKRHVVLSRYVQEVLAEKLENRTFYVGKNTNDLRP
jgi:hypothetical protein